MVLPSCSPICPYLVLSLLGCRERRQRQRHASLLHHRPLRCPHVVSIRVFCLLCNRRISTLSPSYRQMCVLVCTSFTDSALPGCPAFAWWRSLSQWCVFLSLLILRTSNCVLAVAATLHRPPLFAAAICGAFSCCPLTRQETLTTKPQGGQHEHHAHPTTSPSRTGHPRPTPAASARSPR